MEPLCEKEHQILFSLSPTQLQGLKKVNLGHRFGSEYHDLGQKRMQIGPSAWIWNLPVSMGRFFKLHPLAERWARVAKLLRGENWATIPHISTQGWSFKNRPGDIELLHLRTAHAKFQVSTMFRLVWRGWQEKGATSSKWKKLANNCQKSYHHYINKDI